METPDFTQPIKNVCWSPLLAQSGGELVGFVLGKLQFAYAPTFGLIAIDAAGNQGALRFSSGAQYVPPRILRYKNGWATVHDWQDLPIPSIVAVQFASQAYLQRRLRQPDCYWQNLICPVTWQQDALLWSPFQDHGSNIVSCAVAYRDSGGVQHPVERGVLRYAQRNPDTGETQILPIPLPFWGIARSAAAANTYRTRGGKVLQYSCPFNLQISGAALLYREVLTANLRTCLQARE